MSDEVGDQNSPSEKLAELHRRRLREQGEGEDIRPVGLDRPLWQSSRINWDRLAYEAGVVSRRFPDGGVQTPFGSPYVRRALELLLGQNNIRDAVTLALESPRDRVAARVIATELLRLAQSFEATGLAYQAYRAYKGSWPEGAAAAVGLIVDIAHPAAIDWVEEFLGDPDVASAGVALLDELILDGRVQPDDARVKSALLKATSHEDERVRARAQRIAPRH
jgi:hypothetical protein